MEDEDYIQKKYTENNWNFRIERKYIQSKNIAIDCQFKICLEFSFKGLCSS